MQKILELRQKYNSILGQFIDLKQGRLGEIVLRNNEWTDLIATLVQDYVKDLDNMLAQGEEEDNSQRMKEAEIISNYNDGASVAEIALSLEESEDYVKDVIDRKEAKADVEDQIKTDWVNENKPDPTGL